MKDLVLYLVENIIGKKDVSVEESEDDGQTTLRVLADADDLGLLIGKNGQTIKAIQTLLRVRARLENKSVYVTVEEKSK